VFKYNCSNLPTTTILVEEGIMGITSSSFEISLPAELAPTYPNTTLGNIKRHA